MGDLELVPAAQNRRALLGKLAAPGGKSPRCRLDRLARLHSAQIGHTGDQAARRGVAHLKGGRADPCAADQALLFD